jgi:predicted Zn-dependent protease
MLGRSRTEDLLKQVLSLSSADETEAILLGLDEQLTRFANNVIHQHVAEKNRYVVVRALMGRRSGVAATNDLTREGLDRLVETATRAAELSPEKPSFPGLPEPTDVPPLDAFDPPTATHSPADRAEPVSVVCRRAKETGCVASGAFRTSVHEFAVANSHDLFVHHPATAADLTIVVMTDDSSGYAADASWRVEDIDVLARGEEAIDKALRGRHPQAIDAGVYPVVLEPYAIHDILETLCGAAGADPVQEGRSWMTGRHGVQLVSPLIAIWDDGLDPAGWPLPFDFEGLPRQRVDIVEDGVVGHAVYDRERAAEEESQQSTGHALPPANPFSPWLDNSRIGPMPLQCFMAPGATSVEEMIANTERGLYVTRFWYTRTVHPREAVITGMTRDGTFLIEDGELTTPVRNLRFTQSYIAALDGTLAVGDEAHPLWTDPGILSAPALKLDGFNFTGTTEF